MIIYQMIIIDLQHEYNIYNNEDNLIHKYLFNKDTYYDEKFRSNSYILMKIFVYVLKKIIIKLK